MAWVAVDADGREFIYEVKPERDKTFWNTNVLDVIGLPFGTIERILGYELTWKDEAVEINEL